MIPFFLSVFYGKPTKFPRIHSSHVTTVCTAMINQLYRTRLIPTFQKLRIIKSKKDCVIRQLTSFSH